LSELKSIGEYQRMMERFENTNDQLLLPDLYVIVRLDAHRIGKAWRDNEGADYPFGPETVKALRGTAKDLMSAGFRVSYTYTHGDEVSVLLDSLETVNQRKRSRILTLLASHATAAFNRHSKRQVVFHAKMAELPSRSHVIDYFMWQRKVSARNFLTRQIIIRLQAQGLEPKEIDSKISKLSEEDRRRMLVNDLQYPEEELKIGDLYGYGIWWSDKGGNGLIGSESLAVTDEDYISLLERVAFRPAAAVEECEVLPISSETSAPSVVQGSQLPGRTAPLQPIQRKSPFRIDKK